MIGRKRRVKRLFRVINFQSESWFYFFSALAESMSLRYGAVIFGDLTHPLQTQAPTRLDTIISPAFPQQRGRTNIFYFVIILFLGNAD